MVYCTYPGEGTGVGNTLFDVVFSSVASEKNKIMARPEV